jgi:hypothetical protein
MSRYFEYFPTTTYAVANSSFSMSKVVVDISLKTRIIDDLQKSDPYLFLPYTVKEGERAEDIADFYYGSTDYVWLVYFSNDIVDPYDQWIKDTREFTQYLTMKYSEEAGSTLPYDVLEWTKANTIHYKNTVTGNLISTETFSLSANLNPTFIGADWAAIDYYTYEDEENEALRAIRLINSNYKELAESNLRRLLNV